MKPKSTLQWTEGYLRSLKIVEDCDWQTITAITDLLKFHATLLPESADSRLDALEHKLQSLEQDILLNQMGKRK